MSEGLPEIAAGGPIIVGAGLAGLLTAIELSPLPCVVLSGGAVKTGTSTGWAQGGIAAAIGPDDSPDLHTQDTLAAGAGLCDPEVVAAITAQAPAAIARMAEIGARFDRNPDGSYILGLEGAHGRRRIVHAQGDQTGAELLRASLAKAMSLPSVSLWDYSLVRQIRVEDGRVTGVVVQRQFGKVLLTSDVVIIATGGIGGLFQHTTNPLSSRGQGLTLAARAGATLRDVEMVQFHPTGLDIGRDPMPLVSEAVRGEGALLVNELGEAVLDNPLSARDVVSRAEWAQLQAGHTVLLDATTKPGERFPEQFPGIFGVLSEAGIDPRKELLRVRPAAHYHMGGVLVDLQGRSSVPGLYAVGEVASTGLHGANRLASNSLLEAMVCSRWIADHLRTFVEPGQPAAEPVQVDPTSYPIPPNTDLPAIRAIVSEHLGVLRNAEGITTAMESLKPFLHRTDGVTAYLLAWSALQRCESRGAHTRTDFPHHVVPAHTLVTLSDVLP